MSITNKLREFDNRLSHFLFGHHFVNSHNCISWQYMDIVRRKLLFVTLGLKELIDWISGMLILASLKNLAFYNKHFKINLTKTHRVLMKGTSFSSKISKSIRRKFNTLFCEMLGIDTMKKELLKRLNFNGHIQSGSHHSTSSAQNPKS